MKFFNELKRRNVIKASIAYLVVNWVLLQLLSILLPIAEAPDWVIKTLTLLMILGFPIWIIISWVYEVTPEGFKKTSNIPEDQSITEKTNKRLNILIIIGLIAAITVSFFNRSESTVFSSNNEILEKSIAVLPFDDMSSGGDTEWFCDGITEDILTNLSRIKGIKKVISRSSVMQYKENRPTIPEIAKELGVSYILEGSVRKHNDKVIITAQLIDANDNHLWAENYNDIFDKVFEIQKDVSKKIVQQLKIVISPDEEKVLNKSPTDNLKAYEYYLKARSYSEKRTKKDFKTSLELYQQAIDLDPNFADAYAEMALSLLSNMYIEIKSADQNLIKAEQLIGKALKIDPRSAKAYAAKGTLNSEYSREEEAIENLEKALELNPNDAVSHREIARFYSAFYLGDDLNKSLYHINKAIELDPFSFRVYTLKIRILLSGRKLTEAEELFKNKSSIIPDRFKIGIQNGFIITKAEIISLEKKNWIEAIKYLHEELQKDPKNALIYRWLGLEYDWILNDNDKYLEYTKKAYELKPTSWANISVYIIALIEGKKFNEAEILMNTNNYMNHFDDVRKLIDLISFSYEKEDYDHALELFKNPLLNDIDKSGYTKWILQIKLTILAQKGDIKGIQEILDTNKIDNYTKTVMFAILKERDSMYYYLEKELKIEEIKWFNGYNEANPYRKEERYKAFLKKNYLPLTHWNE